MDRKEKIFCGIENSVMLTVSFFSKAWCHLSRAKSKKDGIVKKCKEGYLLKGPQGSKRKKEQ